MQSALLLIDGFIGGDLMVCAYCHKNKPVTKEHIISDSVIELFPECNLTIRKNKVFKADPVIKDVCSDCNNNKLSALDTYGKGMVERYFLITYEPDHILSFNYDYNLFSRFLLKMAYNSDRSYRQDTSWFKSNTEYLLGNQENSNNSFSIFGGLSINTSPLPGYLTDNQQLCIVNNPKLYDQGLIMPVNIEGNVYNINPNSSPLKFDLVSNKYVIRLGSGLFLLFLWKETPDQNEKIKAYERVIEALFPHKLLLKHETTTKLKRCTHAFNYHHPGIVDSEIGMSFADETNGFVNVNTELVRKRLGEESWEEHIKKLRNSKRK